jgi:hypothetical protein
MKCRDCSVSIGVDDQIQGQCLACLIAERNRLKESILRFIGRNSVAEVCGVRGVGVSCRLCHVFTAGSGFARNHAPGCAMHYLPISAVLPAPGRAPEEEGTGR